MSYLPFVWGGGCVWFKPFFGQGIDGRQGISFNKIPWQDEIPWRFLVKSLLDIIFIGYKGGGGGGHAFFSSVMIILSPMSDLYIGLYNRGGYH
ncbi:hypothetical protein CJMPFHDB_00134 [Ostreid herpesvirus 1]|nr:hypothetical protein CJMPFHDB_00005 [Ostreid herpesvirus 1]UPX74580.1 hypothetical protein CJMPFHDB_00134 [Ostreid herpesvirus 1]